MTGKEKQHLKRLAHHLEPVVRIGKAGIGKEQILEIDKALERHELIKVKFQPTTNLSVKEFGPYISKQTSSFLIQTIGKTILLFRKNEEKPKEKDLEN